MPNRSSRPLLLGAVAGPTVGVVFDRTGVIAGDCDETGVPARPSSVDTAPDGSL